MRYSSDVSPYEYWQPTIAGLFPNCDFEDRDRRFSDRGLIQPDAETAHQPAGQGLRTRVVGALSVHRAGRMARVAATYHPAFRRGQRSHRVFSGEDNIRYLVLVRQSMFFIIKTFNGASLPLMLTGTA